MADTSDKKGFNIVICGNYGATNLGDEAILDGILTVIEEARIESNKEIDLNITVLSANPRQTKLDHKVESEYLFPAGVRSFIRGLTSGSIWRSFGVLKKADLFILGGGGLFTDEKPYAVLIWTLQAKMARLLGVPVVCLGQSVGPLRTFFGRRVTRGVYMKSVHNTVRDHESLEVLTGLGVPDVEELADPAFLLGNGEPLGGKPEDIAVFSVRPWIKGNQARAYENLASFIVRLWQEHGIKSVLVPFQVWKDDDLDCLNKIIERVQFILDEKGELNENIADNFVEVFEYSSNYRKIPELMGRSRLVCGMRLHSLIFASLTGCPFIGISYSRKVKSFARKAGMAEYVLDYESFTLDDLKGRFNAIESNRDKLIEKLDNEVIIMRAKATAHKELLAEYF